MSTSHHAQYWAYALTVGGASDSVEHLARTISNARVDLNPHQVDAALFALRSPLSRGVLLADEVGLGKTIEAALVISQRWAERRRHILIVVPAALRKQWQQELHDKFFLPSVVLESGAWKKLQAEGRPNPFDLEDRLIICSYHFAATNQAQVAAVPWDLVVIDEAHRLRNVYKAGAKTARALVAATQNSPKLLLTATPLQNSLMELFGLVSVIDPHVFGDEASFREQFLRAQEDGLRNRALRQRLADVCQRTLRKQVLEYVRFTQRIPVTQEFYPTDDEQQLYEQVSDYLRREELYALPSGQRSLITMVLRKLLASSSFAIAGTLEALLQRLRATEAEATLNEVEADFDAIDEVTDEWEDDAPAEEKKLDPKLLAEEIAAVEGYLALAHRIRSNTKGDALLRALAEAFQRVGRVGTPRKAVVFTESRRTQDYLFKLLTDNGYAGRVVMMNGSNSDATSQHIYDDWKERHRDDGTPTGSRPVDVRAAITEAFKDHATILLATEAAAEGVNLQFCSLVVNYDLPWNPQRVEQRIGRCHRYGQQHDVVVVNFLNQRNAADRRVLDLLSEKFKLFDGVFGASDEILGAVESGVDIERRIAEVYQTCRTPSEIMASFDRLQSDLEQQIQAQLAETRRRLLDHFDEDVHARLRVHRDQAQASLDERGRWLLNLTSFELGKFARFEPDAPRFQYQEVDSQAVWYNLDWKDAEHRGDTFYRVDHPLAVKLVARARQRQLRPRHLDFDYRGYGASISVLEPFVGRSGWLSLGLLTVNSISQEEFLVLAAQSDDGEALNADWCHRLFRLNAQDLDAAGNAPDLSTLVEAEVSRCLKAVEVRNSRYFDAEVAKLDRWSDDLKLGLERELKDLDAAIREARKQSAVAVALVDKLAAQREIKTLEQNRNRKRRDLFEEQDRIDEQRATLISSIERQLATTLRYDTLFTLNWRLR